MLKSIVEPKIAFLKIFVAAGQGSCRRKSVAKLKVDCGGYDAGTVKAFIEVGSRHNEV